MKKYLFTLFLALNSLSLGCSSIKDPPIPESQEQTPTTTIEIDNNTPNEERNVVISFFWNVELRYLVKEQLNEALQALQDMTALSVEDLEKKRYADFYGDMNQWNLQQVLTAYFVPMEEVALKHIYDDLDKPGSREIIRQTLEDIRIYQQTNQEIPTPETTKW